MAITSGPFTQTAPISWAPGDRLSLTCIYRHNGQVLV